MALILLISTLIAVAGVSLIAKPDVLINFLRDNSNKLWLRGFAVVVRLILGIALILHSDASRWPIVITVLGYIAIVAALFIAVLRQRTFERLMAWILSWIAPFARVGGVFAVIFGALLIYAFV